MHLALRTELIIGTLVQFMKNTCALNMLMCHNIMVHQFLWLTFY
jgi:hypothetical protein